MPSSGEWNLMATNTEFGERISPTAMYYFRYYALVSKALTQAGGVDIWMGPDLSSKYYWSSTEVDTWAIGSVTNSKHTITVSRYYDGKGSATSSTYTRPFIHF